MKKLLAGLLALGSISGFTAERSLSECVVKVSKADQVIYLTNEMNGNERKLNGNCLDVAKYIMDMIVVENAPSRRARGISLDYLESAEEKLNH